MPGVRVRQHVRFRIVDGVEESGIAVVRRVLEDVMFKRVTSVAVPPRPSSEAMLRNAA